MLVIINKFVQNIKEGWRLFAGGKVGVATGFGLVFSTVTCFFGYRLLKLWIAVTGCVLGGCMGIGISSFFDLDSTWCIIAGLVCAAILGFLAFRIYLFGVFLLCGSLTFLFAYTALYGYWPHLSDVFIGVGIAGGLLVGFLAVKFVRPIVILATAMSGGLMTSSSIMTLANVNNHWIVMIVGSVLATAGILVQFYSTKKTKRR